MVDLRPEKVDKMNVELFKVAINVLIQGTYV